MTAYSPAGQWDSNTMYLVVAGQVNLHQTKPGRELETVRCCFVAVPTPCHMALTSVAAAPFRSFRCALVSTLGHTR